MRILPLACLLLLIALPASAGSPVTMSIKGAGLFTLSSCKEIKAADSSVGTKTICSKATLTEQTTMIHAEYGLNIGFEYQVRGGGGEVPIDFTLTHPVWDRPDEGPVTRDSWTFKVKTGKTKQVWWDMTKQWELAPGEWVFEAFYKGSKIGEQRFEIVP